MHIKLKWQQRKTNRTIFLFNFSNSDFLVCLPFSIYFSEWFLIKLMDSYQMRWVFFSRMICLVHLPISHKSPVHSGGHSQRNPPTRSIQVPPCSQGPPEHSSISSFYYAHMKTSRKKTHTHIIIKLILTGNLI